MSKTCNFCKGVLVKNLNFFHISILGKIGPENEFHDILKRKRCFFRLKKQEVEKVEKLGFFHRG